MARFRPRLIVLCTLSLIFIYHILPRQSSSPETSDANWRYIQPTLGTRRLAKYMNNRKYIPKIVATESSFDWSKVKFQYPPPLTPTLPPPSKRHPAVQHRFKKDTKNVAAIQDERRAEVKRVFEKSWASYKSQAWMKDALRPLSGQYVDQFSGWAATLVDSLDTLWIMGMRAEFWGAVEAVATIDFGKSTTRTVNMFETCIRYLGGLIAAYELSQSEVLKAKAIEVGNLLYVGFNTENSMPVDFISFEAAKEGIALHVEDTVVSASPGTITLEFTRLSQITGDSKYYAAVTNLMDVFHQNQNQTKLPGMWPMMVHMRRKDVVNGDQFTIAGNADSLYEYLVKAHSLLGSQDSKFETMAKTFMDTAMENLFFRPMIPNNEDILISGNCNVLKDGPSLDPESEHLSCFIGGLYALGGRLFENDKYLDAGERLTKGCMYAYKSMPSGIMPERYNMVKCLNPEHCKWDEDVWITERGKRPEYREHLPKGFTTAKDPRYILRPEAIESVFILWRITGKEEYREAAWEMFKAVRDATDTEYANAAIKDVTVKGSKREDYMESFWMAETLKYFYLVFADTELISLDEYVFNTEAHPFRLSNAY